MNVTVNAAPRETTAATFAELLREVIGNEPGSGIAVAANGEVVPRSQWGRALTEGDTIDILNAVQGG